MGRAQFSRARGPSSVTSRNSLTFDGPAAYTQPILPLRPGIPEAATHDDERHGTTTLFAASMRRPSPVKRKIPGSQGACPLAEYEAAPHARAARRIHPPRGSECLSLVHKAPFPSSQLSFFRTEAICQGRAASARLANP